MVYEVGGEIVECWSEELDFELDDSDASDYMEGVRIRGSQGEKKGTCMVCWILRACIVLACTLRYMWDIAHRFCLGSLSPVVDVVSDNVRGTESEVTDLELALG